MVIDEVIYVNDFVEWLDILKVLLKLGVFCRNSWSRGNNSSRYNIISSNNYNNKVSWGLN